MNAVIIGFCYSHTLPGIIIDMFTMYETFTQLGYNPSIISDIDPQKLSIDYLLPAMVKGYASPRIQAWLTTLPSILQCYSKTTFMSMLLKADIIYYTGHGQQQAIVAPDHEHYPWVTFCRNKVCIFDCCYNIIDTMWVITEVHSHRVSVRIPYMIDVLDRVVIILSLDNKPTTNTCGSDFTRHLSEHLRSKTSHWQSLCDCKILTMYPLMRWIPRSFYNEPDIYVSSDVVYITLT